MALVQPVVRQMRLVYSIAKNTCKGHLMGMQDQPKYSTYILNSKDFMKYTIIDVIQDVEDPIFVGKIKTTQ